MSGWRYYLQTLPDKRWVDKDLPLQGGQVITGVNTAASISGTLPLGYQQLVNPDGTLVIRKWGCQIIAEQDGEDPVTAIVDGISVEGDELRIDAGGFSMYPTDMPWIGTEYVGIQVDPLDMVRKIWSHLQSYPDGDLGVSVDALKSPKRIGTKEKDVEFTTGAGEDVSFESGPFRLATWNTDNLGQTLADLAADTPFQYRERSAWSGPETLTHRLELGYPRLGSRKTDLRFEIGVNVSVPPPLEEGEYASEVAVFGAGEGRKKIYSHLTERTNRLRRVKVVTDKGIQSKRAASDAGRPILKDLVGEYGITSLNVVNHESAPFGTFEPGDEIRVQGDAGWIELDMWVLIQEISINCDSGAMSLKVETV